jgi:4'-phosphopantetheinyl transferase
VLREVLGRYLGIRGEQIRFEYNAFGKPALSPGLASRLTFNLSHSADLAVIAVAYGAAIGVDLEHVRAQPDFADIARYFFSAAEVDHLTALPSHLQARAFFGCWTRREAYVKACGEGLANEASAPDGRWSVYDFEPAPGYIGALVVAGKGWRINQWDWQSE